MSAALSRTERAHQKYRDGEYSEALKLYSSALGVAKRAPHRIALHSNRAACHLKLQSYKEAADECSAVLELDPKHTEALMLRAQTSVALKDYHSALFDVNRLIELDPASQVYRGLQARLKTQLELVCRLSDDGVERRRSEGKWRKVLYGGVQRGFEDNYTGTKYDDYTFLQEMVENANVRKRSLLIVMRDSVAVSQHACVVGLVGSVWTYALNGDLDAWTLLLLDGVFLILGFVALVLTNENLLPASLGRHAFNFTMFIIGLYILAPIFQTLTRSFSSDSIWASTICLLLMHLLFHDYTYTTVEPRSFYLDESVTNLASPRTPRCRPDHEFLLPATTKLRSTPITFSANVSLNASIIASVLIASRLPHSLLVFAVMLFSLEFFLLFPLVTHHMRRRSVYFHLTFSSFLIGITLFLICNLNYLVFTLFLVVLFFITVVSPYELIRIQKFKDEIIGPWDEAKLSFSVGD